MVAQSNKFCYKKEKNKFKIKSSFEIKLQTSDFNFFYKSICSFNCRQLSLSVILITTSGKSIGESFLLFQRKDTQL